MADATRSIGTVLSDIVEDLQHLVRAEVRLARVEVREELGKVWNGAVLIIAAGLVGGMGVGLLLLAAVFALATVWPLWAAALAVGGAVAAIAALLASTGMHRVRALKLPPPKTIETVKENIQWAKTRAR